MDIPSLLALKSSIKLTWKSGDGDGEGESEVEEVGEGESDVSFCRVNLLRVSFSCSLLKCWWEPISELNENGDNNFERSIPVSRFFRK